MKVHVSTTHLLSIGDDDVKFTAKVDDDGTVKLYLPGTVGSEGNAESFWLHRDELLELRALVNSALRLME